MRHARTGQSYVKPMEVVAPLDGTVQGASGTGHLWTEPAGSYFCYVSTEWPSGTAKRMPSDTMVTITLEESDYS